MKPDFAFFMILVLIYTFLFLQGIIRMKKTSNFTPSLRNSFIFYLSILVQIAFRILSNSLIAGFNQKMSLSQALLLLYIPSTLFTLSYLFLIWKLLSINTQAHLKYSGNFSFIGFLHQITASPKHSKVTGFLVFFLTIWIGMQTVLYLVFAGGNMSNLTLSREVLISSLIVEVAGLILLIVLEVKFSSVPIKNEIWRKRVRKTKLIAFYWTFARLARELVVLVLDSLTFQIGESISDGNNADLQVLCVYFVICIFSEIIPIFQVQDYEFIEIFLLTDEEESGELLLVPIERKHTIKPGKRNMRFTMVAENPFKNIEDISIIQSFDPEPHKLGKLYKAIFNSSTVSYRKITFSRLSTYVCEEFIDEIDSYKEILTENIIPILGIIMNEPIVGLISPYFSNGSLYKILHLQKAKFSVKTKLEIAITISEALEEIHSLPRAHGHLTSHNILFDDNMRANISDLGFTKVKKYAGIMNEYTNLSAWSSPEILKDRRVTPLKAKPSDDAYSFAMILWELFSEQVPFDGMNKEQLFQVVVVESSRPSIQGIQTEIGEIIHKCWNPEPGRRPSLVEVTEMLEII